MLRSSFDEIVVVGKIAMFQLIPNHTIFGIQSHWHLSPNYACYAHADGNRGGDFSPLTVCFFSHDISKTDEATGSPNLT